MTDTKWTLHGREFANCNCAYGCPCQFNALPTYGHCSAVVGMQIDTGHHGDTNRDGLLTRQEVEAFHQKMAGMEAMHGEFAKRFEPLRQLERVRRRVHEQRALEVDDRNLRAVA